MQSRTTVLIERLLAAQWFTNVGQSLPNHVHAVRSWAEAVELAKDPDEVFLAVRNEYTARLRRVSPQRDEQWNAVMTLVKHALGQHVEAKLGTLAAVLQPAEHKPVRNQLTWCVLNACMESEYLDVVPAGFFLPMTDWLVSGRVPCGWFGKYPQGMLAVY